MTFLTQTNKTGRNFADVYPSQVPLYWSDVPRSKFIKQGSTDQVTFTAKLTDPDKTAKWIFKDRVSSPFSRPYFSPVSLTCRSVVMETSTRSVKAEDPSISSSEIPSRLTLAATSVSCRTWRISSARPTSMSNVSYSNLIKQEARRETGDGASHAHLSPLSQIYWAVKYVL